MEYKQNKASCDMMRMVSQAKLKIKEGGPNGQ